jgi:hypothetical protein
MPTPFIATTMIQTVSGRFVFVSFLLVDCCVVPPVDVDSIAYFCASGVLCEWLMEGRGIEERRRTVIIFITSGGK